MRDEVAAEESLQDILRTYLRAPVGLRGLFIRTLIGRGDETARELIELIGEADFADSEVAQAACWAIYYSTEAGCDHSYGRRLVAYLKEHCADGEAQLVIASTEAYVEGRLSSLAG